MERVRRQLPDDTAVFQHRGCLGKIQWQIIRQHLLAPGEVLLMASDEVVVTKSGKKT